MRKSVLGIICATAVALSTFVSFNFVSAVIGPACALSFNSTSGFPENVDVLVERNLQMLNPTVRVHANGSTGSATALQVQVPSGAVKTMFVTNYHVIDANVPKECVPSKKEKCDGPPKALVPVQLRGWVTQDGKMYPVIYKAKIVAFDKANDLAVLETVDPWIGPVARIFPDSATLVVGESVWVSGAALGEKVHITTGLLGLTDHEYQEKSFYVVSAPIMPGNSGGGLYTFRSGTYYLTGVPDAIGVTSGQMMPDHGYVIPIRRVVEALAAMKLTIVERQ